MVKLSGKPGNVDPVLLPARWFRFSRSSDEQQLLLERHEKESHELRSGKARSAEEPFAFLIIAECVGKSLDETVAALFVETVRQYHPGN
jgi:hypothetical protein